MDRCEDQGLYSGIHDDSKELKCLTTLRCAFKLSRRFSGATELRLCLRPLLVRRDAIENLTKGPWNYYGGIQARSGWSELPNQEAAKMVN